MGYVVNAGYTNTHKMSSKEYFKVRNTPYKRGGVIYEHIYHITLYPQSENLQFDRVLDLLKKNLPDAKYVYAFHDKDTLEDGTLKKPHYHLIIVFPRERSINKLAHVLEIPSQYIEWKQFLDKSVQYLIHLNNSEKYQYDIDILHGTLDFIQFFASPKESNIRNELDMIMEFIQNNKGHITYYNIYQYVRDNGLHRTYKSWYQIIKDIFLE